MISERLPFIRVNEYLALSDRFYLSFYFVLLQKDSRADDIAIVQPDSFAKMSANLFLKMPKRL